MYACQPWAIPPRPLQERCPHGEADQEASVLEEADRGVEERADLRAIAAAVVVLTQPEAPPHARREVDAVDVEADPHARGGHWRHQQIDDLHRLIVDGDGGLTARVDAQATL